MDWLLQVLPDPREDEYAEGGVLRPLRPSATQPRLPSRQPPPGGANNAAPRRPTGSGTLVGGTRARRPGSAQHPSKQLGKPAYGLNAPLPAGTTGVGGSISVSSGFYHPTTTPATTGANKQPKTTTQPLTQPPSTSANATTPGGGGAGGMAPSGGAPPARMMLGASATDPTLARARQGASGGLPRTQSGMLPARKDMGSAGGSGGAGATYNRGLPRCPSSGVLASGVYSSSGALTSAPASATTPGSAAKRLVPGSLGSAGAGGSGGRVSEGEGAARGGGNFRSEALQLEVRLAEGLQALADSEAAGEGEEAHLANRRLALCRSLFDRIIERDAPFGRLLSRVKAEYEAALTAATQPTEPQLEAAQRDLARAQRDLLAAKQAISTVQEENAMLRSELSTMVQREAQLRDEIRAYQEHAYELQQAAVQHAEAEQAAINAELERELPPSARPGVSMQAHDHPRPSAPRRQRAQQQHGRAHMGARILCPAVRGRRRWRCPPRLSACVLARRVVVVVLQDVTHRLGGEMLLVDEIAAPPPRPSIVPALDMGLVWAKKESDARAEAEDDKARDGGEGEEEGDADDDDDEGDDEEDDELEEEMARLRELHALVASGKIDLANGIPPELAPKGANGALLQAALGLGGEASDDDERLEGMGGVGTGGAAKPPPPPAQHAPVPTSSLKQMGASEGGAAGGAAASAPVGGAAGAAGDGAAGAAGDGAAAGGVPRLDLGMMRDEARRPEGYHDEFLRETGGPPAYDARSAAIDAQLYAHDPTFPKQPAAAPAEVATGTAPPEAAKAAATAAAEVAKAP
jgi:hypothetical protein